MKLIIVQLNIILLNIHFIYIWTFDFIFQNINSILLHYFTTWINPLYSHIKVRTMQLWCDGNYIGLLLYRCILLLTFWFKTNLERRPGRSGGNFTSSFGLVERCCARLLEMEWDDRYIFLNNLGIPFFLTFFYARGIKKICYFFSRYWICKKICKHILP